MAEYLHIVKDIKQRQLLTKYRMSDQTLAIEKGRHKVRPKEYRICGHCTSENRKTFPT